MDAVTFSTALFSELCDDLGFDSIDAAFRFNPEGHFNMFDCDVGYVAKRSLLASIFRKTEEEVDGDAEASTLLSFLEANHACLGWKLDADPKLAVGYSVCYARDLLAQWFEPHCGTDIECTMGSIEEGARFGPGRSFKHGKKPTLYYFKVGDSATYATSDFVRSWYDLSVKHNPLCEAAEMARKARCGPALLTDSGTLSMVPKSYAKKRIIMTEASLNTYFQIGLGNVMKRVLHKNTGIDFSVQPEHNSALAKIGSVGGGFATIDLKQCSDYIALGLVEYIFPKTVSAWIKVLRTPCVEIDGLGKRPLNMASTMGNGFTSALQSTLLAAVVLGVYKTLDIKPERPDKGSHGNFGVFGDDIVVLEQAYPLVCDVLTHLGMIVSENKCFDKGPFRESCGHDYHDGIDVRGVYCTTYTSLQDYYSIFNRLSMWSARHSIRLPKTLAFIANVIGPDNFSLIPPDESVVGGVISPYPPFNEGDGTWKYALYVPRTDQFKFEPWTGYYSNDPIQKESCSIKRWVGRLKSTFGGSINEPAFLKSMLFGAVRRGRVTLRLSEGTQYRLVNRETPRWGYSESPLVSSLTPVMTDRWHWSLMEVMKIS